MLSETEEHCSPGVRLLEVGRQGAGNCGFHLTRSKWDPYPWVSSVDDGTAAETAGLRPGDCLLEVNGEDVLGQRVGEIAEKVRARPDQVSLLLWNAGVDPHCGPESLCCGPMPSNMQRLSTCMASILSAMECPVCLDTIPPPACQCVNGHLLCARCHSKSERCPVCRMRLSRGRSLFADQVYTSLTDAFELSKETDVKKRTAKINELFRLRTNKNKKNPEIKITQSHTNKFLARFVEKSSSAENLSNQFLTPRSFLADEFNSNLRAKSLSTSEICCPGSPGVISRSGLRGISKTDLVSRLNSCRRSYESLDGNNMYNEQTHSVSSCHLDDLLYYCPFSIECSSRIKGEAVLQHFQDQHEGPLIQYFKSKITFNLQNYHNETYCILHTTGKYFFLKINALTEENESGDDKFNDILIWMWLLGSQNIANEYQLKISVYYSSCPDKHLLSLHSAVYSLSNMAWKNMKDNQKGVFISRKTLQALSLDCSDIILQVDINHC